MSVSLYWSVYRLGFFPDTESFENLKKKLQRSLSIGYIKSPSQSTAWSIAKQPFRLGWPCSVLLFSSPVAVFTLNQLSVITTSWLGIPGAQLSSGNLLTPPKCQWMLRLWLATHLKQNHVHTVALYQLVTFRIGLPINLTITQVATVTARWIIAHHIHSQRAERPAYFFMVQWLADDGAIV